MDLRDSPIHPAPQPCYPTHVYVSFASGPLVSQVRVQTVSPIDSVGSESPWACCKPPETRLNCGMVTSVEIANFLGDRVLELKIKQDLDITGLRRSQSVELGPFRSFLRERVML